MRIVVAIALGTLISASVSSKDLYSEMGAGAYTRNAESRPSTSFKGEQELWRQLMTRDVLGRKGCLASIWRPAARSEEGCRSWRDVDDVGPAFDSHHNTLLVGGKANSLLVLSASSGEKLSKSSLNGPLSIQPLVFDYKPEIEVAAQPLDVGHVESAPVSQSSKESSGRYIFIGTREGEVQLFRAGPVLTPVWKGQLDSSAAGEARRVGDSLFVRSNLGSVYVFELPTGKVKWVATDDSPAQTMSRKGVSSIAVLDATSSTAENTPTKASGAKMVIAGFANGTLRSYDFKSGELIREIHLGQRDSFNDIDGEILIVGDEVIVGHYPTGVYGLTPNLNQKWHIPMPQTLHSVMNRDEIWVVTPHKIHAFSRKTRQSLWESHLPLQGVSKPIVSAGNVFLPVNDAGVLIVNGSRGQALQWIGSGLGVAGSPYIIGDLLYMMSPQGVLHIYGTSNSQHYNNERGIGLPLTARIDIKNTHQK